MFLTGCVSSLSAQQSFWKEDFSAGKLPDGWMIVDSTKSSKCEWIVTAPKTAIEEIARFFKPEELFEYDRANVDFIYYQEEYKLT